MTVTSTAPPAAEAGAVAVTDVAETVPMVAETEPKWTDVAPLNPVPVIVTIVPPLVEPVLGLMRLTVTALDGVVVVVVGCVVVVVVVGCVVVVVVVVGCVVVVVVVGCVVVVVVVG